MATNFCDGTLACGRRFFFEEIGSDRFQVILECGAVSREIEDVRKGPHVSLEKLHGTNLVLTGWARSHVFDGLKDDCRREAAVTVKLGAIR